MPPVPIILRWPRRAVRSKLCGIAHLALKLPPSRERANDPTRRRSADVAGDGVALVFFYCPRAAAGRRRRVRSPHIHPPDSLVAATGPVQGRASKDRAKEDDGACPLSPSPSQQGDQAGPDQGTACLAWSSACLACVALRTEQTDKRASITDGAQGTRPGVVWSLGGDSISFFSPCPSLSLFPS